MHQTTLMHQNMKTSNESLVWCIKWIMKQETWHDLLLDGLPAKHYGIQLIPLIHSFPKLWRDLVGYDTCFIHAMSHQTWKKICVSCLMHQMSHQTRNMKWSLVWWTSGRPEKQGKRLGSSIKLVWCIKWVIKHETRKQPATPLMISRFGGSRLICNYISN